MIARKLSFLKLVSLRICKSDMLIPRDGYVQMSFEISLLLTAFPFSAKSNMGYVLCLSM